MKFSDWSYFVIRMIMFGIGCENLRLNEKGLAQSSSSSEQR